MTKRSVNFHRAPKGAGLGELAEMVGLSDLETGQMARDVAASVEQARQARIAAAKWRVCWRRTAADEWTEEYFTSSAAARDRKHVLRSRRLWAAIVQLRAADGAWITL